MKATILELRRNPKKILDAIERNETVTLSKRGREIAQIVPRKKAAKESPIRQSPAFGLWQDRKDMADPPAFVRQLRRGRYDDF